MLNNNPVEAERSFAIPGKLHVFVSFMLQFIIILTAIGILPSELHNRGMSQALSWSIAVLAVIILYWAVALAGRLVPVRCKNCEGVAHYRGLGWWPFMYWFDCRNCGY